MPPQAERISVSEVNGFTSTSIMIAVVKLKITCATVSFLPSIFALNAPMIDIIVLPTFEPITMAIEFS